MTDETQPNESVDPRPEEPQVEVVEVVEIVDVVEIIEEPLADTAAVDAAIARSSEAAVEPAVTSGPISIDDIDSLTAAVVATEAAAPADAAPSWGPETVAPAPGFAEADAHTVYVAAPLPPKAKGNRGFATLVALIGSAVFTALYAGVYYILLSVNGRASVFNDFLQAPLFWGVVVVFFLAYVLLGVFINRGPYWAHAVFSFLIAVVVYFGAVALTLVTVLLQYDWSLTAAQSAEVLRQAWLAPHVLIATVIAREIPVWFGGWIARNGRKVTARNQAAMDAYDREVAAAPLFQ